MSSYPCCKCGGRERRIYLCQGKLYCPFCLPVDGLGVIETSQVLRLRAQAIRELIALWRRAP